jgi:hypothetical protein
MLQLQSQEDGELYTVKDAITGTHKMQVSP